MNDIFQQISVFTERNDLLNLLSTCQFKNKVFKLFSLENNDL